MNKREFYKELMSEYAFDKEKILINAKKGKRAGRGPLPIYIGMTAAAAAIVVAAGTAVMTVNGRDKSAMYIESNTVPPFAQLPDQDRINKAMDEIKENEKSAELHDVLVNFSEPITPREAQEILTSYSDGNIPVKMLYLADGSSANGRERVGEVFDNNTEFLSGAVINCAGYVMQQLQQNEKVLLVEIVSEEDLGVIAPIVPDESNKELTDSLSGNTTSVPVEENIDVADGASMTSNPESASVYNNSGVSSVNIGTGNESAFETGGEGGEGGEGGDTAYSTPEEISSVTESGVGNPGGEVGVGNAGGDGGTKIPVETAPQLPEGAVLPRSLPVFEYTSDYLGAEAAYFLNENTVFVKTSQSVALYVWDGTKLQYLMEKPVEEPQVFWISENGSRLMVSGKENGSRSKIYVVDASAGGIYDSHAEGIVGNGTIVSASYNESANMLALNIYNDEKYNLVTASVYDDEAADYNTVFEGGTGTSVIAQHAGVLYFSETVNASTAIYKVVDGEAVEVDKFKGACTVNTNCAFTHAVLNGGDFGRAIFDPASESMILLRSDDPVEFGVSPHSLSYGGKYYTISGGELVSSGHDIKTAAKIEYRRSFSSGYCAEAVEGAVRITSGMYTAKNMSEELKFEIPAENCSAEQRAALELGLGIQNALVNGVSGTGGILPAETLRNVIPTGFSETASSELRTRYGTENGGLAYNIGGLKAVNISECALVMQDEYSGTVYVKAGVFGGKTGYLTRGVRFVSENGALKMDSLIEL